MTRAAMLLAVVLGAGCPSTVEPPAPSPMTPAPATTPPAAPATPAEPPAAIEPAEAGPPLVVIPKGLSDLYEGFFADPDALDGLSKRLGHVLDDPSVTVEVVWTEEKHHGLISLLVPDRADVGEPVARQVDAGGPVDPAPLRSLLGSVGAWRAELGGKFDLRLLSFETRIVFWDEQTGSRCWMSGPMNDPTGLELADCFVCALPKGKMEDVCRQGDAWPAPLTGSKRAVSMLGAALKPRSR